MACLAFLTRILNGQKNFIIYHKKGLLLLTVSLFYFGYLALGGFIFCAIEGPQETLEYQKLLKVKTTVLTKFPNVPEAAINHIYEELSAAGVKGVELHNDSPKWTFGNSFLFSMTLLTTIGYGHLSPATELGKIVCMLYTGFGIPITLLILAMHVEWLNSISGAYKENLFRMLGYNNPFAVRTFHFTTTMLFLISGTFLLPAWVFQYLEVSWTFLDALYFCFISLTTVGLGDFVPGTEVNHPYADLYRILATIYLIVGVTLSMFMMSVATDYYQNCNKGYREIPLKVISEKVHIKSEDLPTYGAIIIPETSEETRLLLS